MSGELVPLHPLSDSEDEEDFIPRETTRGGDQEAMAYDDDMIPNPSRQQFKQMYSDLIETCQELNSGDGLGDNLKEKMEENVLQSKRLFDRISGGPSEMYIACLHTKILSEIVRHKSDTIGSSSSGFKLDSFLDALKTNHKERIGANHGAYDIRVLSKAVSTEVTVCGFTVPSLCNLVGSFDKDAFAKPVPKIKKIRSAPVKKNFETTNATKHVEVNVREEQRIKKDQSAVKLSMDLLHILQIYHIQNSKALGLYNFTMDKNSLAKTIKYIFYLGFLVREGCISLRRDEKENLVVRPETPPKKGQPVERQQFIFSITPKQWRALSQASQGEDIITAYKIAHLKSTPQKQAAATPSTSASASTPASPEMPTPDATTRRMTRKRKAN